MGTQRKDHIVRPDDPVEALTGTVAGFVYLDTDEDEGERIEGLDALTWAPPRAPRPAAYRHAGAESLLTELAGSSWESTLAVVRESRFDRPAPRPIVYAPQPEERGYRQAMVDLSLQVSPQLLQEPHMEQPIVKPRGPWPVAAILSVVIVLAAILFGLCGWLVIPPG
jgi:hypothetical protein